MDYNEWLEVWESPARLDYMYWHAGPLKAEVAVVGQRESKALIPFVTKYGTKFAYDALGDMALEVGWTYASGILPQLLRDKNGIIVCGKSAAKWLKFYVGGVETMELLTPQYLLTRSDEAELSAVYEAVRAFVENHTKEGKSNGQR